MSLTLKSLQSVTITADPDPCTQLLDVPAALLTIIMQHVPLQDRLGVCTRVCRSFHAAAVAATNSITMSMRSQPECDQLAEWLQRHGAGLTALSSQYKPVHTHPYVPVPKPSLASLPCPQLRDLNLSGLYLQPGFLSTCTSLTRLLLRDCRMQRMPDGTGSALSNPLMQLSVLTSLQHLGLGTIEAERLEEYSRESPLLELPGKLLSHLVQLTYLQLADRQVQSDAALQHLSTVSALQHLELSHKAWGLQNLTPAVLTGLQHLTALRLYPIPWDINQHNMPAVTVLTALRVLQLWGSPSIDPAVLAGFSSLQEVDLKCTGPWDPERSAALLAAIERQTQLRRLAIYPALRWSLPSAANFSALTASSYLQHLELRSGELPVCAWQQMFPPGRCLPELRHLVIQTITREEAQQQLSLEDIQAMVSCGPALAHLNLGRQLAVSTAVPLQQLTGLTNVSMHASFQDTAASIAQLTGLQHLVLYALEPGERVTVSWLLQLTVLQQLRYIAVKGATCDPGLAWSELDPDSVHILNKAPAGAPPDV